MTQLALNLKNQNFSSTFFYPCLCLLISTEAACWSIKQLRTMCKSSRKLTNYKVGGGLDGKRKSMAGLFIFYLLLSILFSYHLSATYTNTHLRIYPANALPSSLNPCPSPPPMKQKKVNQNSYLPCEILQNCTLEAFI